MVVSLIAVINGENRGIVEETIISERPIKNNKVKQLGSRESVVSMNDDDFSDF